MRSPATGHCRREEWGSWNTRLSARDAQSHTPVRCALLCPECSRLSLWSFAPPAERPGSTGSRGSRGPVRGDSGSSDPAPARSPCPGFSTPGTGPGRGAGSGKNCLRPEAGAARSRSLAPPGRPPSNRTVMLGPSNMLSWAGWAAGCDGALVATAPRAGVRIGAPRAGDVHRVRAEARSHRATPWSWSSPQSQRRVSVRCVHQRTR